MQLDNNVLENLEKLSHLKIDDSKKNEVIEQLSNILTYIENLNELNTDNLESSFSTLDGGTPMRKDTPREPSTVAQNILSKAPNAQDDFFIVPAIIE